MSFLTAAAAAGRSHGLLPLFPGVQVPLRQALQRDASPGGLRLTQQSQVSGNITLVINNRKCRKNYFFGAANSLHV